MTGLYALDGAQPKLPQSDDWWIAPGAVLLGDVIIAEGVGIWFNATIRGDNDRITIGEGSNIQELCCLHADPGFPIAIGRNVTVGHKAMVHGCEIGDGSLIGMNAVILNGAKIGRNCLIGANAMVTEGKEIPDNSVVMGQPGRVVREVSPPQLELLKRSAEVYRAKIAKYRKGMTAAG
jgi:carbonic anhydrase/acetyltransferase-like protein (isoleucine patch superfamily)